MIKRAAFEAVSLFSEDYFMYAEDLDLCYKVRQAGYTNYYVGEGEVIHHGGKSSEPESATMMNGGPFHAFATRIEADYMDLCFESSWL